MSSREIGAFVSEDFDSLTLGFENAQYCFATFVHVNMINGNLVSQIGKWVQKKSIMS